MNIDFAGNWINEILNADKVERLSLVEKFFFGTINEEEKSRAVDLGIGIIFGDEIQLIPFVIAILITKYSDSHLPKRKFVSDLFHILEICRTHCQGEQENWAEIVLSKFDKDEWPDAVTTPKEYTGLCSKKSEGDCFEEFSLYSIAFFLLLENSTKLRLNYILFW